MGVCVPQLRGRLLLLGAATLAVSALETASPHSLLECSWKQSLSVGRVAFKSGIGKQCGLWNCLALCSLTNSATSYICTLEVILTADLVHLCGQTWQGPGMLLRSHSTSRRFYFVAPDTDCKLWIQAADPGDRIHLQFRFFLVYSLMSATPTPPAPNASTPEPSDPCIPGSYLQLYEGPPEAAQPLGAPLCGLTIPVPVISSGHFLGLRLVTRGHQPRVDFVGEVTSFRLGPCGAYFRCHNGKCIPPSLVCDRWSIDNCGDGSDQASWAPANCRAPSPVPSHTGSFAADSSKSPPLRSAGTLWITSQGSPPEAWGHAPQDTALQGYRLHGVALAASLLLACAGLLLAFLWCCCSSGWLARQPAVCGLCCSAVRPICHACPSRVVPGGLGLSGPRSQDIPGHA